MMKTINQLIFWLIGWKLDSKNIPPEASRCVMTACPHTSNWDFPLAAMSFSMMGIPYRFTIKREWVRFPFSLVLKPLGAIAIDRRPKKAGDERPSMVQAMAQLFEDNDKIAVLVTPEGTRSRVTAWRTGFYHVAVLAKVPICLGYLDFEKKTAGVGKVIYPSGDLDKDMRLIMDFYKDKVGRHPEKFSLDENYS